MIKKKPTLKDIAKEANVSSATVSYVLNNIQKEKISHETRLKVIEAAKNLNYIPDLAARSLSKKKSNLVSIIINTSTKSKKSKAYMCYDVASELEKILRSKGYDTIIITTDQIENEIDVIGKRSLECVFTIDINNSSFRKLAPNYWAPVINIDAIVNDNLFYEIVPNYGKAFSKAKEMLESKDVFLMLEVLNNNLLFNKITADFKEEDIFINSMESDMKGFLEKNKNRKGIIVGDFLGVQVERFVDNKNIVVVCFSEGEGLLLEDTKRIFVSNKKKAMKAVNIMDEILLYDEQHEKSILID